MLGVYSYFLQLYLTTEKVTIMSKSPNKSKITKKKSQYIGSSGINIDLSSLYMQSDLEISSIEYEETTYHLYCTCKLDYGICPYCCHSSHQVHSRYTKTIADMSILAILS